MMPAMPARFARTMDIVILAMAMSTAMTTWNRITDAAFKRIETALNTPFTVAQIAAPRMSPKGGSTAPPVHHRMNAAPPSSSTRDTSPDDNAAIHTDRRSVFLTQATSFRASASVYAGHNVAK